MSKQIYKGYLVVAVVAFNEATRTWVPEVDISWDDRGLPRWYRLAGALERFTTQQDAESFAIAAATAWVDDHINPVAL
ncbi:MAG: hypothetical protein ACREQW_25445 [Candidatus Binatia bacterium]